MDVLEHDPVAFLVAYFKFVQGNNVLTLLPLTGQGVNLTLDDRLLHSCCKLLQNAVAKADWGIKLEFPQTTMPAGDAEAPRTLN